MFSHAHLMIDLHGCSVKDAKKNLAKMFSEAKEKNITELYIITGRGNHVAPDGQRGILKKALPSFLKPYCDEIELIDPEIGSYRVILKQDLSAAKDFLKTMSSFLFGTADENFHKERLKKMEQKAQQGDIKSLISVACTYLSEPDTNNTQEAIKSLTKAKELGSVEAYDLLGELYLDGIGVKKNYREAITLLQYAANHSHSRAQLRLAECYLHGRGVKQSDQDAIDWLKKAAELGSSDAMYNLGYSYFMGEYSEKNDELAVKYLTAASERGQSHAKTYLARCYACGYGVKQDTKKAFSLYQQAAACNDIYSIYQVGKYYIDGRAGEINATEAFKYFQRGAKLGDLDCEVEIGRSYLFGVGVSCDIPRGMKSIQEGVTKKNRLAYYIMSHAYRQGLGVEKNFQEAKKFMELAAAENLDEAQFELSIMLLFESKEAPEKHELALSWLQKAAKLNNAKATYLLEKLSKEKDNSEKNSEVKTVTPLVQHSTFKPNEITQPDDKKKSTIVKEEKNVSFAGLSKGFLK